MTEEKIQLYIKETVAHAKDSFFSENSNLVDMIMHKIEPTVEKSIEKHVNGKIRVLDAKITEYIKADELWKQEITPRIEIIKNVQGFGKVTLYFLGFISAIGGAIILVINLFKLK